MEVQSPINVPTGPLVWIDCEMTGLNPRKDKILEIAVRQLEVMLVYVFTWLRHSQVVITNGNLESVDEGLSYIIRTDKELLDGYVWFLLIDDVRCGWFFASV